MMAGADDEVLERLWADRFSCRAFRDRAVAPELLERVFELAQRAPSWCNAQPWFVHLLDGDASAGFARALSEEAAGSDPMPDLAFPELYDGDYRDRRHDTAARLYGSLGIERSNLEGRNAQLAENFRFFGAPVIAVISTPRAMGVYGVLDCGAYVGSLLLAAQSVGLGSIAQAAPAAYSTLIRGYLSIPRDRQVVCTVSFGYPDETHAANAFRSPRADLDAAIDWRH